MSDKRHPTRMHELLGVEPHEPFEVKGHDGKFILDSSGAIRFGRHFERSAYSEFVAEIINYPERIIRRPRLTEEQETQLKALVTLGYGWLVKDLEGLPYACASKPKKERDDWRDGGAFIYLYPFMPTNCLMDLPDWSDPEPLGIVQTLRDAGVEVDDG